MVGCFLWTPHQTGVNWDDVKRSDEVHCRCELNAIIESHTDRGTRPAQDASWFYILRPFVFFHCNFDKSNSREHQAEHGQFKRDVKLYRALPWRIVPNVAPLRWMIVPNVVLLCWTIVPMSFRGVEWLFTMSVMLDDHRIGWIVLSLPVFCQCLTHSKYGVVNQNNLLNQKDCECTLVLASRSVLNRR